MKAHVITYDGEPVCVLVDPDWDAGEFCNMLSPDEGLAEFREIEIEDFGLLKKLAEMFPEFAKKLAKPKAEEDIQDLGQRIKKLEGMIRQIARERYALPEALLAWIEANGIDLEG